MAIGLRYLMTPLPSIDQSKINWAWRHRRTGSIHARYDSTNWMEWMNERLYQRNRRKGSPKLGISTFEDPTEGKPISMAHLVNPPQLDMTLQKINDTTGNPITRKASTAGMTDLTGKINQGRKAGGTFPYEITPNGERRIIRDCNAGKVVIPKTVGAATTAELICHTSSIVIGNFLQKSVFFKKHLLL